VIGSSNNNLLVSLMSKRKHRNRKPDRGHKVTRVCLVCSTQFQGRLRDLKRGRGLFCSKSCAAKHTNPSSYPRTCPPSSFKGRSNPEKIAYKFLSTCYSGEIVQNDRTQLSGYELDLYLPELKIGIEINGPTHYRPIYGAARLERSQAVDALKKSLCAERGITLFSINVDVKDYKALLVAALQGILSHIQSLKECPR
jgi:hypothetical protein